MYGFQHFFLTHSLYHVYGWLLWSVRFFSSLYITITGNEHFQTQNSNGNEIQTMMDMMSKRKKMQSQVFLTDIHFCLNEFHIHKPSHHIIPVSFCTFCIEATVIVCALISDSHAIYYSSQSAWISMVEEKKKTVYYNIFIKVYRFSHEQHNNKSQWHPDQVDQRIWNLASVVPLVCWFCVLLYFFQLASLFTIYECVY